MSSDSESSFQFETWDEGRLIVNIAFAELLRRQGMTTFAALMSPELGCAVRQIGSRLTSRLVLDDSTGQRVLYLKRHGRMPLLERIKPLLHGRRSIWGARPEWEAILRFHALGLPTMTPVLIGEWDGCSCLITEELPACQSLLDWSTQRIDAGAMTTSEEHPLMADDSDTEQLRALTNEVADLARQMHAAGFHHQDFYLNHLLLARTGAVSRVHVIDLGRVSRPPQLAPRWIIKDLAQLNYSARHLPAGLRWRFLKRYFGRPLQRTDLRWVARILRKSREIERHTRRHSL